MTALSATNPTLLDLAKRLDPNLGIADIVELLEQENEILMDMTWQEGNLLTGHRTTVRTGIPTPTWRKLNGGVQPTKTTTAQITASCGMLEAYSEVDKALADLNGNTTAFRLSEDKGIIEGLNQELADTLFYGNADTEPETFDGLSRYYSALSGIANSENIIDGGSNDTDNQSIWLVVWGPRTLFGVIPKGSTAGLQVRDLGEVTVENIDGAGGRMQAYRTHFRWDAGLVVRDWRYAVRIANIEVSDIVKDAATGAHITDLMIQAMNKVPNLNAGRPVWYMSRDIRTWLQRQLVNTTKNSTLTQENQAGRMVMSFGGIPVRRVDRLASNESRLT